MNGTTPPHSPEQNPRTPESISRRLASTEHAGWFIDAAFRQMGGTTREFEPQATVPEAQVNSLAVSQSVAYTPENMPAGPSPDVADQINRIQQARYNASVARGETE